MATNFPNSLDSLTNPATTDQLNSPSHAAQHANANDAIEQLQAKVGVNSSAVTTSHDYKIAQLEAAITAGVSGTKLIYQDVRNQSGASLTKGTPVRVTGSDGASGKLLIGAASNSSEGGSSKTFGLLSSTLSNNSNGQVVTNGLLEGVDTTGAVDGDPVWLGVNGAKIFGLVNKPVAPAHLVYLGVVVRGGQQNTGSIFVSIQNGFEVDELHNVLINNTTLQNKDALVYDSTTQLWKNYDLSQDFVLSGDLQNSLGDYIPLNELGQPSGPAALDADGNLIVPENKIIIEGATADANELTIQAPDVTSDITVTLPNATGTLALTSDITTAVNNLVNSAPNTLDTLNELATALGNDANFATTTATSIGNKVSKAGGDTITPATTSTIGLTLASPVGQTGHLLYASGGTRIPAGGNYLVTPGLTVSYTSDFNAGAANIVPITVKGAASQTANLQEWQNSAGTILSAVNALGQGVFTNTTPITASAVSQTITAVSFTSTTATYTFSATAQTISVGEYVTVFGITPSGYNGTYQVTAVATVSAGTSYSFTVANNTNATVTVGTGYFFPSASVSISTQNKAHTGLIIKAVSGQTASTMEIQNSLGQPVTWWDSTGGMTASQAVISTLYSGGFMNTGTLGYFNATTFSPSVRPIVVRGAASQSANLQEWQNSAGTVLASIGPNGTVYMGSNGGANIATFYNGTSGYGAGSINSAGTFNINGANLGFPYTASGAVLSVNATYAGALPLSVRGYASQTASLQEWQNSSGTVLAKINSTGELTTPNIALAIYGGIYGVGSYMTFNPGDTRIVSAGLSVGATSVGTSAQLQVTNNVAGTTAMVIKGAASQTAALTQWQDSAGTVLAKVDSTGAMHTVTAAANTNTTQVATTAYVQTELADLVNSAPATLDTLKELSDALGADANFATTVTNNLALKAPLASPTLTGTPTAPTAAVGTDTTQIATTAFVIDQIDASTQPGALYQTTAPTSPEVGQIWIDSDDNVTVFDSNIVRRQPFTATAGQTNFVTTVPFIDGFEQVYFNGLLLLKTTDYTTSGNNTVILGSAAAANDIIEVVTITNLNSVNTYTQAETNALIAANSYISPVSISANTNLLAKKRYFVTSASALTLTLPASPTLNDEIQILDASGNASTYNITVARNGNNINGGAGNLIIDMNGAWVTLLYTGATYGWKVG